MSEYLFRKAGLQDIDFLVESIIEAEKGGTEKLGLSTLFNLKEDSVAEYIRLILLEGVEGCEFSLESFFVFEFKQQCIATAAAWIEANNSGHISSSIIKSNLFNFFIPFGNRQYMLKNAIRMSDLFIERIPGTLQFEYVYVNPAFRGQNIACKLIKSIILSYAVPIDIYIQVFSNNIAAIRCYEKVGFKTVKTHTASKQDINDYLPFHQKLLMKISKYNGKAIYNK